MKVVYTIGNFIPVPLHPSFNTKRNNKVHDYWDLTLLAIYEYYRGNGAESKLAALFEEDSVRNWLNSFGDWTNFVEKNFMNPFVEKHGDLYGRPRELWDGHFNGIILPRTRGQFEQFFVNATVRILARGQLMAEALKAVKQ